MGVFIKTINKAREEAWEKFYNSDKAQRFCFGNHNNASRDESVGEFSFNAGYGSRDKEVDGLKARCEKLKTLILFTVPILSSEECANEIQLRQWSEYCRCFPDEGV